MTTITRQVTLVSHTCGKCGVVFAMTREFEADRLNDHGTFWCPNGHPRVFTGKSEADKLREKLAQVERQRDRAHAATTAWMDQADAAERSARAYKGHLTRLRKRIANGVCPCCQRSFANVRAHIHGQHPEWAAEHTDALTEDR